jgi:hypothetical protein
MRFVQIDAQRPLVGWNACYSVSQEKRTMTGRGKGLGKCGAET